jgi:hypothetical protein
MQHPLQPYTLCACELRDYFTGCGSGKYLSLNPMIFNMGTDRCKALTEIAREKDNEVRYQPKEGIND